MNDEVYFECNFCCVRTVQHVSSWFDDDETKPSVSYCDQCGTETVHEFSGL